MFGSLKMIDISIIVPCFNAIGKIEACVKSLLEIDFPVDRYEVLFVDDCSTDETYSYLKKQGSLNSNWRIFRLDVNSGSPSAPRNKGVSAAKGKYVFFLDCDDEIFSDTLRTYFAKAEEENADIIRGYLITDDGKKRASANKILSDKFNYLSKKEKIEKIIKLQSTTVPSFIRRELLIENNIEWDVSLRMGEDTVYLISVLVLSNNIIYLDHPTFIYNKKVNVEASSTQSYGARELRNHLKVWQIAQEKLSLLDINYYKIRLQVGLQTSIQSMIQYNRFDISTEDFLALFSFVMENKKIIEQFDYNKRIKEVLEHIYNNNYDGFIQAIKQRLVIAGYDLKFILIMIPSLENFYQVKIDEWTGHNSHDETKSLFLLEWADIVFCEWMLGNAVWYSNRVKAHQKLFIRMHRFELTTQWFTQIDFRRVNRVFAVSVYFFEKLIEYTRIPRSMACLLPNYVDSDNYQRSDNSKKLFNIGIIGILPSRKGYLNALHILKKLVDKDKRYNLSVYGKMPQDLTWVKNDPSEMKYFNKCEEFITKNGLQSNIEIKGWVDVKTELKDIGFVLSTSENEEIPESFHLAPADGFSAGNQGLLLQWNGVEYIYPSNYIFGDITQMVNHILTQTDLFTFKQFNEDGLCLIKERYSLINVVSQLIKHIKLSDKNYSDCLNFQAISPSKVNKGKQDKSVVITHLKNKSISNDMIEIDLADEFQSHYKINITYNLTLPINTKVNSALVSLRTNADTVKGFNISTSPEVGIYKYLETVTNGCDHVIELEVPKGKSLTSIVFKQWNKDVNIFFNYLKIVAIPI